MIKAIDSKYCKNNLVQLIPNNAETQLIISTDEIILLREGDNVFINKYLTHPSRKLFKFTEKNVYIQETSKLYHQLFEYNKLYLNFSTIPEGYIIKKNYFFKGSNRALWLNEGLLIDERVTESNIEELSRRELEKRFNFNNYDSMYIIDNVGKILFAYNKKDGSIIKRNIIPTDKEIVDLDYRIRMRAEQVTNIVKKIVGTKSSNKTNPTPKSIDEIKNLNIYAPNKLRNYSHILITSKDNQFTIKWFRLEFLEKDKFKLTTSNIPVVEPTIDDVLNYSKKYPIENTYTRVPEGYKRETDVAKTAKPKTRRKTKKLQKYLNEIFTAEDFKNHI